MYIYLASQKNLIVFTSHAQRDGFLRGSYKFLFINFIQLTLIQACCKWLSRIGSGQKEDGRKSVVDIPVVWWMELETKLYTDHQQDSS